MIGRFIDSLRATVLQSSRSAGSPVSRMWRSLREPTGPSSSAARRRERSPTPSSRRGARCGVAHRRRRAPSDDTGRVVRAGEDARPPRPRRPARCVLRGRRPRHGNPAPRRCAPVRGQLDDDHLRRRTPGRRPAEPAVLSGGTPPRLGHRLHLCQIVGGMGVRGVHRRRLLPPDHRLARLPHPRRWNWRRCH